MSNTRTFQEERNILSKNEPLSVCLSLFHTHTPLPVATIPYLILLSTEVGALLVDRCIGFELGCLGLFLVSTTYYLSE